MLSVCDTWRPLPWSLCPGSPTIMCNSDDHSGSNDDDDDNDDNDNENNSNDNDNNNNNNEYL